MDKKVLLDVSKQLESKRAVHETFHQAPQIYEELLQNKAMLELVYKIYYLDYKWFDYPLEILSEE